MSLGKNKKNFSKGRKGAKKKVGERFLKKEFIILYGDWGLGIGDWAQSPIPNPQSPIPNPHYRNINKSYNFYIYILNKIFKISTPNFIRNSKWIHRIQINSSSIK